MLLLESFAAVVNDGVIDRCCLLARYIRLHVGAPGMSSFCCQTQRVDGRHSLFLQLHLSVHHNKQEQKKNKHY